MSGGYVMSQSDEDGQRGQLSSVEIFVPATGVQCLLPNMQRNRSGHSLNSVAYGTWKRDHPDWVLGMRSNNELYLLH